MSRTSIYDKFNPPVASSVKVPIKQRRTFTDVDLNDGSPAQSLEKVKVDVDEVDLPGDKSPNGSDMMIVGNQCSLSTNAPNESFANPGPASNGVVAGSVVVGKPLIPPRSDSTQFKGVVAGPLVNGKPLASPPSQLGNAADPNLMLKRLNEFRSLLQLPYPAVIESGFPLPSLSLRVIGIDNPAHSNQRWRVGNNLTEQSMIPFLGNSLEWEFSFPESMNNAKIFCNMELPNLVELDSSESEQGIRKPLYAAPDQVNYLILVSRKLIERIDKDANAWLNFKQTFPGQDKIYLMGENPLITPVLCSAYFSSVDPLWFTTSSSASTSSSSASAS
jgi:hypothetical protein